MHERRHRGSLSPDLPPQLAPRISELRLTLLACACDPALLCFIEERRRGDCVVSCVLLCFSSVWIWQTYFSPCVTPPPRALS